MTLGMCTRCSRTKKTVHRSQCTRTRQASIRWRSDAGGPKECVLVKGDSWWDFFFPLVYPPTPPPPITTPLRRDNSSNLFPLVPSAHAATAPVAVRIKYNNNNNIIIAFGRRRRRRSAQQQYTVFPTYTYVL